LNGNIKNTGIAINLSNTDSRGFPAATDTTGKAGFKNDGFHLRSVSANVNQQVSQKVSLNGNFQTSYNTGDLPYGAFTDDKNYTYNNTFLFGGLGAKLQLDKGELKVNLSQNDVWNNYNDLASAANGNYSSYQKNTGNITNAEAVFNYSLCKHLDITSGADFKYYNTNQLTTYDTISRINARNSIVSVYSSFFLKWGIFHTELGGRYNHDAKYGSNFTYTVNPSIFVFDQLKIFATMASAYKSPTLYQLYSPYHNIGLKPETTDSYEAGFEWEVIKRILFFNTAFYKYKTTDVIYFKNLPAFPFGIYENGEHQNDQGYESELKLKLDKLTAATYLSYVTGTLTDENGFNTGNLYRRPKFTFGANVNYQFTSDFSAGLIYKYTGDRTDEKFNADYSTSIITLKPYGLLDAHLQYTINKHFSLFADFKNILDQKYTDWIGYNTSRFNFMAGIRYQIN